MNERIEKLTEIIALLTLDGMEVEWRVLIKYKGTTGVVAMADGDTPEKILITAWKEYEKHRKNKHLVTIWKEYEKHRRNNRLA